MIAGAETRAVETHIVEPLERALWGIAGVEHVYSSARPGFALITARFRVNQSNEESLVKVFERQSALFAVSLPPGALPPSVEPGPVTKFSTSLGRPHSYIRSTHIAAMPGDWLAGVRVDVARRLLEATALPVEEVARLSGFGSVATLRLHFGRATKLTPREYRERFGTAQAVGV